MSFFLISLMAISIAGSSVIGVAYIRTFYWFYYVMKVFKYSLEYRMKCSDKAIFIMIFLYTFFSMFAKDFYLHYSIIGHVYHTEEELLFKIFVFCLAGMAILTPSFAFAKFLYRNAVIRTIIIVGFGFSDLMAINWVSRKYFDGVMSEARYLFVMGTVSCPPAFFSVLKESFSLNLGNVFKALKETRNICTVNVVLGAINIWVLDYLRHIESNYYLVSHLMINAVGMTLYFSFKSYQWGVQLEEKFNKENLEENGKDEAQKIEKEQQDGKNEKTQKKKRE